MPSPSPLLVRIIAGAIVAAMIGADRLCGILRVGAYVIFTVFILLPLAFVIRRTRREGAAFHRRTQAARPSMRTRSIRLRSMAARADT